MSACLPHLHQLGEPGVQSRSAYTDLTVGDLDALWRKAKDTPGVERRPGHLQLGQYLGHRQQVISDARSAPHQAARPSNGTVFEPSAARRLASVTALRHRVRSSRT